jgi:2,3-bisphosphoglycerate-dependent phosphoglycerate mutase
MAKAIFLVRHCKAEGQEAEAPLSAEGVAQAILLAESLASVPIERIISSPFRRAIQSIEPLSQRIAVNIELDARLAERVLCAEPVADWQEHLERSFQDMTYCMNGGESSFQAMQRVVSLVDKVREQSDEIVVLVSHGNLMTLLLQSFDDRFGFSDWLELTNPDVYRIDISDKPEVNRYSWHSTQQ